MEEFAGEQPSNGTWKKLKLHLAAYGGLST
jgi:hypothetical protein